MKTQSLLAVMALALLCAGHARADEGLDAMTTLPGGLQAGDELYVERNSSPYKAIYSVPNGGGITALTGDVTASGVGSVPASLAVVNATTGTFNNVTVDAKGRVTFGSNVSYLTAPVANASLTDPWVEIAGQTVGLGSSISLSCENLSDAGTGCRAAIGTLGTQSAGAVSITGGSITGTSLAGTLTGNITGNAATVTTNANLTGPVTSTGNATAIGSGVITNTMLANAAVTLGSTTVSLGSTVSAIAGLAVSGTFAGALTGNAATATALAAAPTGCSGGQFSTGIAANGNSSCATPSGSGNVSGPVASTSLYVPQWNGTTGTLLTGGLPVGTSGTGTILETTGSGLIAAGVVPTLNQSTTGNAATASALSPGATINGVAFTGAANVTVPAAAGTLTGSTLAAGVTASSLTSVGTLANLTVTNPIAGSVTGNAATVTTNANLSGVVTSSGNTTSFGSFASAVLAAALTDKTGTGAVVFAGSPTLTGTLNAGSGSFTGSLTAGSFSGPLTGNVTGSVTGNAGTVTTNANLTGPVTSVGNATSIAASAVTNAMLAGSIAASKLIGTDIATVGTITAGTWQGSSIGSAYLPLGSSTAFGILKCDGTTITCASGVASAVSGGGGGSTTLGTSATSTSPSATGVSNTGLFSAGTGLVDVAGAGSKAVEFSSAGATVPGILTIGTSLSAAGVTIGSNAAASYPSLFVDGYPYTGGSGTTTVPQVYIRTPNAMAISGWSTNGTILGMSIGSSFNGNLIDLRNDVYGGTSTLFSVGQAGQIFTSSGITAQGQTNIYNSLGVNGASTSYASLAVNGNAAVGSSYQSVAAPSNGMIVQGNVGIGTSAAPSKLTVYGLGATSPGSGGGYVCADSNGDMYVKSSCP